MTINEKYRENKKMALLEEDAIVIYYDFIGEI